MAGSYRHITNSNNELNLESGLIENLGDANEALEECYWMIHHLTGGDKQKTFAAWRDGYAKRCCPPENFPEFTYEIFWSR